MPLFIEFQSFMEHLIPTIPLPIMNGCTGFQDLLRGLGWHVVLLLLMKKVILALLFSIRNCVAVDWNKIKPICDPRGLQPCSLLSHSHHLFSSLFTSVAFVFSATTIAQPLSSNFYCFHFLADSARREQYDVLIL